MEKHNDGMAGGLAFTQINTKQLYPIPLSVCGMRSSLLHGGSHLFCLGMHLEAAKLETKLCCSHTNTLTNTQSERSRKNTFPGSPGASDLQSSLVPLATKLAKIKTAQPWQKKKKNN